MKVRDVMHRAATWIGPDAPLPEVVAHIADEDVVPICQYDRLVGEVHRLEGDDAVPVAVKAMAAGQALSRIDDHATILGARLRYLFTGDPDHLAAEVR